MNADLLAEGLFSVEETAKFLSLSKRTIFRLMETGELTWCHIGSSRRIPRLAAKALAAKRLYLGTESA